MMGKDRMLYSFNDPKILRASLRSAHLVAPILVLSVARVALLRRRGRLQGAQAHIPGETCCHLQSGRARRAVRHLLRERGGDLFFKFWRMILCMNVHILSCRVFAYFYRISFGFLFIFLILLFSEIHLHSAVTVISLCFLCFLLLLWYLRLCCFLENKTTVKTRIKD